MTVYELFTSIWITLMGLSALVQIIEYIEKKVKSKRRSPGKE